MSEEIKFTSKGFGNGEFILPAGDYVRWYENRFGYFYAIEGKEIVETVKTFSGLKTFRFKGGLWLAKKGDVVFVYELRGREELRQEIGGEIATFAAWEAGDKDGMARQPKGIVPQSVRERIGLPGKQQEQ